MLKRGEESKIISIYIHILYLWGFVFSNFRTNANEILSGRVLVLNQSYEPLSICTPKRAITLLYLFKAELIEKAQNKLIHSVSKTLDFPSVIKLNKYQRIPYREVELSKKNIFRRDSERCQYCGTNKGLLTIDHIIPKSRGGAST